MIDVRAIRPDDRTRILNAVAYTSAETYYRRFHLAKHGFTGRELSRLTELDGDDQFALIATERERPERLVAVARVARDPDSRTDAELAIIVHDPYQHHGIGQQMLRLLVDAALERGITHLTALIQADNHAMIGLLRNVLPQATLDERDGSVCTYRARIAPDVCREPGRLGSADQ